MKMQYFSPEQDGFYGVYYPNPAPGRKAFIAMLWDTCKYIRRMTRRLETLPHECEVETLIYEHGTHFVFPQSMLKTMLPVGSGLLGCFCFGGGDWLMLYGDTAHQGSLFRLTEVTALIGPSGGGEIGHVRRVYPEASPGVSDDNWREWFHPLWKAADKPQVHLLSKIAFQCPKQFRNLKAQKANNRPITL